jgi:hypothetical protein
MNSFSDKVMDDQSVPNINLDNDMLNVDSDNHKMPAIISSQVDNNLLNADVTAVNVNGNLVQNNVNNGEEHMDEAVSLAVNPTVDNGDQHINKSVSGSGDVNVDIGDPQLNESAIPAGDQQLDKTVVSVGDRTVDVIHNRIVDYWLTRPHLGQFYPDTTDNDGDQAANHNITAHTFIEDFVDYLIDDPVTHDLDYEDSDPGTDDEEYETDPNDYSDEDLDNIYITLRRWHH